ncbi:MAG TPA: hypothetical protein VF791_05460 [Pyrinomonadaceae bacterium]
MNSTQKLLLVALLAFLLVVVPSLIAGGLVSELLFTIPIGVVMYVVVVIAAKRGRALLAMGAMLFILGGGALLLNKLMQNLIQDKIQRGVISEMSLHDRQASAVIEYVGYGAGIVGIVLLIVGLLQKKQIPEIHTE